MVDTFIAFGIISLLLFIFGAALGSFINVLIYRSMLDEDWAKDRSRCESCKKKIAWYDNIPLFSFLLLGGKCRNCKATISVTHPVVEFLTGTLLVWWYWGGALFFQLTQAPFQVIQPIFWLVIAFICIVIIVSDVLYYIIPDVAVALLIICTLLYRVALLATGIMQPTDFVMSIVAAVVASGFFGLLWYFTKGNGMGLGDVKLMVPIALLVGWPMIVLQVFLAFVIGAAVGVLLITLKKKQFGQHLPFGPFLIISTFIVLLWGDPLLQWYMNWL